MEFFCTFCKRVEHDLKDLEKTYDKNGGETKQKKTEIPL